MIPVLPTITAVSVRPREVREELVSFLWVWHGFGSGYCLAGNNDTLSGTGQCSSPELIGESSWQNSQSGVRYNPRMGEQLLSHKVYRPPHHYHGSVSFILLYGYPSFLSRLNRNLRLRPVTMGHERGVLPTLGSIHLRRHVHSLQLGLQSHHLLDIPLAESSHHKIWYVSCWSTWTWTRVKIRRQRTHCRNLLPLRRTDSGCLDLCLLLRPWDERIRDWWCRTAVHDEGGKRTRPEKEGLGEWRTESVHPHEVMIWKIELCFVHTNKVLFSSSKS